MNSFKDSMERLKQALQVREDQQVAERLGMTKWALSERKKRGAFPVDKLLLLVGREPELGLDIGWILTGASQPAHAVERQTSMAAQASKFPEVAFQESVADLVTKEAKRNQVRSARYEALTALAEHCDDPHLNLLITVAEAFRKASSKT